MSDPNLDFTTVKALAHPIRWRIIQELRKEPMYGKKLARILNVSEQKVYHHLKILEKASIIKIDRVESKKGALSKYFTLNQNLRLFSHLDLSKNATKGQVLAEAVAEAIMASKTNNFKLIVGNPDPHGPYNAISRDGYLSSLLSWTLKKYLPSTYHLEVMTDSEFLAQQADNFTSLDSPLISIGGPITNVVTNAILKLLRGKKIPIRIAGPPWMIKTNDASYQERTCGLVLFYHDDAVFPQPIALLAGIGRRGTKASILALEQVSLAADLTRKNWWSVIVQGFPQHGKKASDIRYVRMLDVLHG